MPQEASKYQLYFDDPRLKMTVAGRFTVRVLSYISYLVVIAATVTFLISENRSLQFVGLFLVLFLIDRFVHRRQADIPISELPKQGKINLARYVSPASFSAIDRAFDKALVAKEDLYLVIAEKLLGFPQIANGLVRLDIKVEDFKQK